MKYEIPMYGPLVRHTLTSSTIHSLVFAIGARYSHLIAAEWQADDHDHLVYMWRAVHLLQLGTMDTLFSQPDKSLIQVSFYLTRRTQPVP
jgi:hypothetical protein